MINLRIVLLVASLPWLALAHAGELDKARFADELSKQESIYHSQGEQTVEGYTVDRALAAYADGLASDFNSALAQLGPMDRWLDIGAGKAHAILDYYSPTYDTAHPEGQERRGAKARAVAISIEDRRGPRWQQTAAKLGPNQIQYFAGRRLGQYSVEELGRFQIITDVLGGFSYTDDLSRFMEKVLGLLEVTGNFFTVLQDIRREEGTSQPHYAGSPFLTEIANPDGSEMKVCSWLKRISCVEVKCESRAHWTPPVEAFRVRKVCDSVTVPPLAPLQYEAGTPPQRRFLLTTNSARGSD
ncbi:MAG: hypothetical protein ACXW2A_14455 [Burkholderiales bacterium]